MEAASDKQAADIVLLDAREACAFTDYFVICTGGADRQLHAIYDEVEHVLKKEGMLPHHHEGALDSGWLVLDYGNVIVHIFTAAEREYYQLDKLWSQASLILSIQ